MICLNFSVKTYIVYILAIMGLLCIILGVTGKFSDHEPSVDEVTVITHEHTVTFEPSLDELFRLEKEKQGIFQGDEMIVNLPDIDKEFIQQTHEMSRILWIMEQSNPTLTNKQKINFSKEIVKAGRKHNVSPTLIASLIHRETNFKPKAISSVGASGLMQVHWGWEPHLERLKTRKITMQQYNDSIAWQIDIGTEILAENIKTRKGDIFQALIDYVGRNGSHISYATDIFEMAQNSFYSNKDSI